ncbi:MAG TPA: hypothetical protein VN493_07345 [Thermoanaerobaculia bacterium]|nr:hypothetical protein [Thermoanaerobaculia bacterium]
MLEVLLEESAFYTLIAGFAFALLLSLVALALLPTLALPRTRKKYLPRLGRTALFLVLLFAWGGIANGVWFCLPSQSWYFQADPVIRYLPIAPVGEWWLDRMCGGHLKAGFTMLHLQALWLVFTLAVWGLAWLSYKRVRRGQAQPHQAWVQSL